MQVMPCTMGSLDLVGNLTGVESDIEAGCMILADDTRRLGEAPGIPALGNHVCGRSCLERVEEARVAVHRRGES